VLTSPWKIGVFVALMLVVISFGVGYYMADIYGIDLKWIRVDSSGWHIDSFLFFKEMYPLVAGVVLLALTCYFLIASAVRRYKYYLDSGQDYRKMISLAESIDDLTNPAQIAKLSDYPELQEVLRNYGDQIREISREIEEAKERGDTQEFEDVVNALLQGEEVDQAEISGKWYSSLYERMRDFIKKNRETMEEFKKKAGLARTVSGKAALLIGKVAEEVRNAEIRTEKVRNTLEGLMAGVGDVDGKTPAGMVHEDGGLMQAIITDMETSVRKLKEISKNFSEFSNENNNLALSLALMAAKGQVSEGELAQYAEKIRVSAEGFNRMSGVVGEISDTLTNGLYGFKERISNAPSVSSGISGAGSSPGNEVINELMGLVDGLRNDMKALSNEVGEIEEILKEEMKDLSFRTEPDEAAVADQVHGQEGVLDEVGGLLKGEVNLDREGDGRSSDLAIERSDEWRDEVVHTGESRFNDYPDDVAVDGSIEVGGFDELDMFKSEDESIEEEVGERETLSAEGTEPAGENGVAGGNLAREAEEEANSWMEMPGHRWIKVDVEQNAARDATEDVDVQVHKEVYEERVARESDEELDSRVNTQERDAAGAGEVGAVDEASDGEPVYDLFELGAVEIK